MPRETVKIKPKSRIHGGVKVVVSPLEAGPLGELVQIGAVELDPACGGLTEAVCDREVRRSARRTHQHQTVCLRFVFKTPPPQKKADSTGVTAPKARLVFKLFNATWSREYTQCTGLYLLMRVRMTE